MHEVALPIKNIDQASKNFDRKVNGTGGVDSIEVNANLHNPKDSHTPAEGGWLVRIRAGRHVNNPGASRKDKNAASVIAVGNGRNFENAGALERNAVAKAKAENAKARQNLKRQNSRRTRTEPVAVSPTMATLKHLLKYAYGSANH